MKSKLFLCTIITVLMVSGVQAKDKVPVLVSPGIESGTAVVSQACPTFSWTAVDWAEGYQVAVFKASGSEILNFEEIEVEGTLVLSKQINGRALSWTPSEDTRLSGGEVYVWYVRAVDGSGGGLWSEGRQFKLEERISLAGIENKVRESFKEEGVSKDIIDRAMGDAFSGIKEIDIKSTPQIGGIKSLGTEGATNTFYGLNAGVITTGLGNAFFGVSAGRKNTTGTSNTFNGHYAGYNNTTGNYNTFSGSYAGNANTTGTSNTFNGYAAGRNNTTGYYNNFNGYAAGHSNTTGYSNTFSGYYTGSSNTTGQRNTFIGVSAGRKNTTGSSNTFNGYVAGHYNTTGHANTFAGHYAGYDNTTGSYNTFNGTSAGSNNITGSYNTFNGTSAGSTNTIGNHNTFNGYASGFDNTTGSHNTFNGTSAGSNNTTATANAFLGTETGYNTTEGGYNTFFGQKAGYSNTIGHHNTYLGKSAGYNSKNGSYNSYLGLYSGYSSKGSRNVFIGHKAGYFDTGSDRLYISNSDTTTPLLFGRFDTKFLRINGKLGIGKRPATHSIEVLGGAYCNGTTWVDASSRALKNNIEELEGGEALDTLKNLQPVKFNYKNDQEDGHVGFIAEDVPDLVATKDRKGMSAMDVVAVLTQVVKEQQKSILKQKKTNKKQHKAMTEYKKNNENQQKTITDLVKRMSKLEKQK